MRIAIVLLILAAFGGSFLYWLVGEYPGFVLVSVGSKAIQFTLWTGVLAVLALWLLLRVLISVVRALVMPSMHLTKNWKAKKQQKNSRLTHRGLFDLAEGRWTSACKQLSKSAADSELALINYLGAASAAAELGNEQEAERLLSLAEKVDTRNAMAVALTRVRLLLSDGNYTEALPILQELHGRDPKHSYILSLLAKTYRNLEQWDQLEKLLADLRANKAIEAEGLYQLEVLIRVGQLRQLTNNLDPDMAKNKQALADFWGRTAKNVRSAPAVVADHAKLLAQVGEAALAEKELRKAIKNTWDKHLLATYGQLEGDAAQRLKIAEGWLKEQPDNVELLLSLARLCKRSELWGKARDYLEVALKVEPRSEIYAELAEVLGRLGEHDKSLQFYRQGLLEVTTNEAHAVGLA